MAFSMKKQTNRTWRGILLVGLAAWGSLASAASCSPSEAHRGAGPLESVVPPGDASGIMKEQPADRADTVDTATAARPVTELTARAAAKALGVSERTVRRAIARGELPATKYAGTYRIADLRPGTYVVSFTMSGFNTFRREVRIAAEFTATINADLAVGSLEETVTVTGASPVVDVTTAVHTQTLDREAIDVIPTGRSIQSMAQLVVGLNLSLPDTGGARAMQQTYMSTHGMTTANTTVLVDGLMVNGLQGDGAIQSYFNDAMNQEVSYQTAGIGADTSSGGVRLTMIPREGGNRFSGDR